MKLIALCSPALGGVLLGVVGGDDGAGQGRVNAVAAHAYLGGFGDGLACGAFVDDVGLWEALRPVQLAHGGPLFIGFADAQAAARPCSTSATSFVVKLPASRI